MKRTGEGIMGDQNTSVDAFRTISEHISHKDEHKMRNSTVKVGPVTTPIKVGIPRDVIWCTTVSMRRSPNSGLNSLNTVKEKQTLHMLD